MARNNPEPTAFPYVDLHVHTRYSDSSLSPAQAVAQAVLAGVGVLALADHEEFSASIEAMPIAKACGIRLISAAELECTQDGVQYHVLCYGADMDNQPLRQLAARSRALLDSMSDELIERMRPDYPQLSLEGYAAFEFDRAQGGWKALGYFVHCGITDHAKEGMALYAHYGVRYETAGFPTFDALLTAIHGAGGRAVLAHCGHTLRALDEQALLAKVSGLLDRGLDGVECYYPLHTPQLTAQLIKRCQTRGAMITAGSDCHGQFGHTRVGEMDIRCEQIDLKGL